MNEAGFAHHKVYGSVSLAAPAVRMVAVAVSIAWREEPGHPDYWEETRVAPVVAIRSVAVREFSKRYATGYPRTPPTVAGLARDGWHLFGSYVEQQPLFVSEEYGDLKTGEDEFDEVVNVTWRLVACPWPPEEDEARLAGTIESLRKEARADAARHRAEHAEAAR